MLERIDYRSAILESPSPMEQAYVIFANVIELSDDGVPTDAGYAELRETADFS